MIRKLIIYKFCLTKETRIKKYILLIKKTSFVNSKTFLLSMGDSQNIV